MKHIKLFESFNVDDIKEKIDDISAYIPVRTSNPQSKWCLPNFDTNKIKDDEEYEKYKGSDKNYYLRYYN